MKHFEAENLIERKERPFETAIGSFVNRKRSGSNREDHVDLTIKIGDGDSYTDLKSIVASIPSERIDEMVKDKLELAQEEFKNTPIFDRENRKRNKNIVKYYEGLLEKAEQHQIKDAEIELFATVMHEVGHVLFSSTDRTKDIADYAVDFFEKEGIHPNVATSFAHYIDNVLEDGRIEHLMGVNFKGTIEPFKFLNIILFEDGVIAEDTGVAIKTNYTDLMSGIWSLTKLGMLPYGYEDMDVDVQDKLQELKPLIKDCVLAKNPAVAFDCKIKVIDAIKDLVIKELKEKSEYEDLMDQIMDQLKGMGGNTPNSDGPIDESDDQSEGSGSGQGISIHIEEDVNASSSPGEGNDDDEQEVNDDDEQELADSDDDSEDGSGNGEDDSEESSGGGEGEEEDEDEDESDEDAEGSGGGKGEEEDEDEDDDGSGGGEGEEEDEDEDSDGSEDGKDNKDSEDAENEGSKKDRKNEDASDEKWSEEKTKNKAGEWDWKDESHKKDKKPKTKKDVKEKLKKEKNKSRSQAELPRERKEITKQEEPEGPNAEQVAEGIVGDFALSRNNTFKEHERMFESRQIPNHLISEIDELKEVVEHFYSRPDFNLRHRPSGLLDTRNLVNVKLKNYDVFQRMGYNTKMDPVIMIVWDGSGSMCGGIKQSESARACTIIEGAFGEYMPIKIVNFSSDWNNRTDHYLVKDFDEKADKDTSYSYAYGKVGHFGNGNNDGMSIKIATEELLARPETDKILVVLSDGMPTGYVHKSPEQDVARVVSEAKEENIHVVSIFFGDEYFRASAEEQYINMYQDNIVNSDVEQITENMVDVFKNILL